MSRTYLCLPQNTFRNGNYSLVPLRDEDKYAIMQWRNEQIAILRQKQPLTKEEQKRYFATTVASLFIQQKPQQLLFSFLENDVLIGYGGLVHIDWESKNAEVSFITETKRNADTNQFINDWINYLKILKEIAKNQLQFIKIYTYAYDLRPHLYNALFKSGFVEEARLKNHIFINGHYSDVLIHSCFLNQLVFRMADENDMMQYFEWANDEDVRKNSFSNEAISLENHKKWFNQKLNTDTCFLYIFLLNGEPAGQVRIENIDGEMSIDISVDKNYRGQNIGTRILQMATIDFLKRNPKTYIYSYVKKENPTSLSIFKKAGFTDVSFIDIKGIPTYKLILNP